MKLDTYLIELTKILLEIDQRIKYKLETMKFLETDMGEKISLTLVLALITLDLTPEAWETKAKINNQDSIKLKASAQ